MSEVKVAKLCKCVKWVPEAKCPLDPLSLYNRQDIFHTLRLDRDYTGITPSRICLFDCAPGGVCKFGARCCFEHPRTLPEQHAALMTIVKNVLLVFLSPDITNLVWKFFDGKTFQHQKQILASPYPETLIIQDKELICPLWLTNKCRNMWLCTMSHRDDYE